MNRATKHILRQTILGNGIKENNNLFIMIKTLYGKEETIRIGQWALIQKTKPLKSTDLAFLMSVK
jgi:hypothetical protein